MIETAAQGETGAPNWDAPSFENMPAPGEAFVVDIDGFEGPLDLLLALARTQKVDIAKISILALVEQYLGFISQAQQLRLEIAADYLVMAAWLAYLKSRLLLPKDKDAADTASAEELAQRLAFRLMRLDAMRDKAATLHDPAAARQRRVRSRPARAGQGQSRYDVHGDGLRFAQGVCGTAQTHSPHGARG